MKGTIKIITVLLIVIALVMVTVPVFATGFNPQTVIDTINQKANTSSGTATNTMASIAGGIINFIRNLAIVIGIVMLSIIGIKYMIGSAEEKASYKKTLVPLAVGIIIVVAATSIISMVFTFTGEIQDGVDTKTVQTEPK